jgi:large subunit ribosomal protein L13
MSSQHKCFLAKPGTVKQAWHVVDADGQIVGRLAVRLATILMGKHKPTYTAHVDTGDFVVVVNAERVKFGGRPMAHASHPYFSQKMLRKTYDYYTKYPGGLKRPTGADLLEKKPEQILYLAVKRMLPKTKMGRQMLKKLKLYAGPNHPHQAQEPSPLSV